MKKFIIAATISVGFVGFTGGLSYYVYTLEKASGPADKVHSNVREEQLLLWADIANVKLEKWACNSYYSQDSGWIDYCTVRASDNVYTLRCPPIRHGVQTCVETLPK